MFKRNIASIEYDYLTSKYNYLHKRYKSKNNQRWQLAIRFANTTLGFEELATLDIVPLHYVNIIVTHLEKLLKEKCFAEIQRVIIAIFILSLISNCDLPIKLGKDKSFLNFLDKLNPNDKNNHGDLIKALGFERPGLLEYFVNAFANIFKTIVLLFKPSPVKHVVSTCLFANVNVNVMNKASQKIINKAAHHSVTFLPIEKSANDQDACKFNYSVCTHGPASF